MAISMRDGGDILALGKNLAQAMKKITTGNGLVRHELWLDSKRRHEFGDGRIDPFDRERFEGGWISVVEWPRSAS